MGGVFHSFAFSINGDEFKLWFFLFMVHCIVFLKYFEVPYGADPIVQTTDLRRKFSSGLCVFKVRYKFGRIEEDGYVLGN